MEFTREEIEDAALVLVVDEDGAHKWSSNKADEEVAQMLEDIAALIRGRGL